MQGALSLQGRTQPCYIQSPGHRRMQYRHTVQRAFRADDSNNPTLNLSTDKSVAGSKHTSPPHQPSTRSPSSTLVSNKPGVRSHPSPTHSGQPLWKNPSFPFVAAITAVTLPIDLAVGRHRMAYSTHRQPITRKASAMPPTPPSSSSSSSSSSVSSIDISSLNRHAKPAVQHTHTPLPAASVDDITDEAAVAAGLRKPPSQTNTHIKAADVDGQVPGSSPARPNPEKLAAEVRQAAHRSQAAAAAAQTAASKSTRASQAAADKQQAAGFASSTASGSGFSAPAAAVSGFGVPSGTVDSWDSSDQAGLGSDEEAEQAAKAMVIELLTHPKDTEAALMRAAASQDGGGGAGGRGLSVSPDYIDALVNAAREPSVGMPHQQTSPQVQADATPKGWGAQTPPFVSTASPATDPEPAQPSSSAGTQHRTKGTQPSTAITKESSRQGPTKSSSPSLWSWFEASPHSSQEEF